MSNLSMPVESVPPRTSTDNLGSTEKFRVDQFKFLARIRVDAFGKVMLAETVHPRKLYAVKVLGKKFISENDEVGNVYIEKNVYRVINRDPHPFLACLYGCFQTNESLYFATEYLAGGDLMTQVQRGRFGLIRSRFYAAEICLALDFLHKKGILYRNVKPDSVFLALDGHIKLMDFGLCKENIWHDSKTSTFCGTAEFMAPEILLDKVYGRPVDWWGFGVLLYQMLLQQAPFCGDDEDEVYDAILEGVVKYPQDMPEEWLSVLQKLLKTDPDERLGSGPTDAQEIMSEAFFHDIVWDDIYHKKVTPPFIPTVSSDTDTSNFDAGDAGDLSALNLSNSALPRAVENEFRDFDYTAEFA